jgi:hypothetical protein
VQIHLLQTIDGSAKVHLMIGKVSRERLNLIRFNPIDFAIEYLLAADDICITKLFNNLGDSVNTDDFIHAFGGLDIPTDDFHGASLGSGTAVSGSSHFTKNFLLLIRASLIGTVNLPLQARRAKASSGLMQSAGREISPMRKAMALQSVQLVIHCQTL